MEIDKGVIDIYTEGGTFLCRVESEEDNVEIVMALLCSELQQRDEFKDIHVASLGFKYYEDDKDVHPMASLKGVSKLKLCSVKGRTEFNYDYIPPEDTKFSRLEETKFPVEETFDTHFILPDGSIETLKSTKPFSVEHVMKKLELFFPDIVSPPGRYRVDTMLSYLPVQRTYKIIPKWNKG